MDIEALAVAAVKAAIAKTDYLVDYIKDKEPMWDGLSMRILQKERATQIGWVLQWVLMTMEIRRYLIKR